MPIIMRVERLHHIHIPSDIYYALNEDTKKAVRVFIDLGGCGWDCALEMQKQLWDEQRGQSIDNLRWALERSGIDTGPLLGWNKNRFDFGATTCQKKEKFSISKIFRNWIKPSKLR